MYNANNYVLSYIAHSLLQSNNLLLVKCIPTGPICSIHVFKSWANCFADHLQNFNVPCLSI